MGSQRLKAGKDKPYGDAFRNHPETVQVPGGWAKRKLSEHHNPFKRTKFISLGDLPFDTPSCWSFCISDSQAAASGAWGLQKRSQLVKVRVDPAVLGWRIYRYELRST